mmetsp:Transcript_20977/g.50765  ORF Transcript_20977/g.50765 Transcript_20977/m.50765 type:complete len:204 (+) Transcript_20977:51-662(+)
MRSKLQCHPSWRSPKTHHVGSNQMRSPAFASSANTPAKPLGPLSSTLQPIRLRPEALWWDDRSHRPLVETFRRGEPLLEWCIEPLSLALGPLALLAPAFTNDQLGSFVTRLNARRSLPSCFLCQLHKCVDGCFLRVSSFEAASVLVDRNRVSHRNQKLRHVLLTIEMDIQRPLEELHAVMVQQIRVNPGVIFCCFRKCVSHAM